VSSIEQVPPFSMAGEELPAGIDVFEVRVSDPFIEADPETFKRVTDQVEKMELGMLARNFNPLEERSEANSRDERNIYTKAWLRDENMEGLSNWRDFVPTALALDYLTNPWVGREIEGKEAAAAVASPETSAYLRFVADAVAIRDR